MLQSIYLFRISLIGRILYFVFLMYIYISVLFFIQQSSIVTPRTWCLLLACLDCKSPDYPHSYVGALWPNYMFIQLCNLSQVNPLCTYYFRVKNYLTRSIFKFYLKIVSEWHKYSTNRKNVITWYFNEHYEILSKELFNKILCTYISNRQD